jgi:hypothetical protein
MKKSIMLLILIIIFFFPIKAYASTTIVEVNVEGKVKKGEEVNILINMKGLESLYAASVNFTYDDSILNIVDITAGESIKNYGDEIMEIGGEVDTSNNKTSYSFTFLGDKGGINGDATLAIIKAKVLKDGSLSIGEDDIKVKLVKRVGDGVENYDYKFIGCSTEDTISNTEIKTNNSNNKDDSSNSATIDNNQLINNSTDKNNNIENKTSDGSSKTLENNNENNSNSYDTNLDSTNDENIDKYEKELENNINISSEKNDDEITESNNDKKSNLIIDWIIILFILIGVMAIYYYKSKKTNYNK